MVFQFLKRVLAGTGDGKGRQANAGATDPYPDGQKGFRGMITGRRYEVVREFVDHDRIHHPVGETWIFRGDNYLPYEDGQSLFLEHEPGEIRQTRLQWREGEQDEILDNWHRYVREVE